MSNNNLGGTIRKWWLAYIAADSGPSRALSAHLRRSSDIAEVLSKEPVFKLGTDLNLLRRPTRLACLAHVVASVKEDSEVPFAKASGLGDARPALSEIRFQRIITVGNDRDLGMAIRRALPMINNTCNIAQLGVDIYYWGDNVASQWCFQYFGARSQ